MPLSYLASPLSLGNIQGSDYLIDLPDQSAFDADNFARYVLHLH